MHLAFEEKPGDHIVARKKSVGVTACAVFALSLGLLTPINTAHAQENGVHNAAVTSADQLCPIEDYSVKFSAFSWSIPNEQKAKFDPADGPVKPAGENGELSVSFRGDKNATAVRLDDQNRILDGNIQGMGQMKIDGVSVNNMSLVIEPGKKVKIYASYDGQNVQIATGTLTNEQAHTSDVLDGKTVQFEAKVGSLNFAGIVKKEVQEALSGELTVFGELSPIRKENCTEEEKKGLQGPRGPIGPQGVPGRPGPAGPPVPRVKMERPVRKVIADLQARQALRAVRVSRAHKVNQACKAHRVSQVHRVNLDSGVRRALQVKT